MARRHLLATLAGLVVGTLVLAQDQSVRPGINDPFKNPNVQEYIGTFEGESREIFAARKQLVAACKLKPGLAVADIGAGTGLFTRLFAREVGPTGKVYAVDIAANFLDHIRKTCREGKITNVDTVQCTDRSTEQGPLTGCGVASGLPRSNACSTLTGGMTPGGVCGSGRPQPHTAVPSKCRWPHPSQVTADWTNTFRFCSAAARSSPAAVRC